MNSASLRPASKPARRTVMTAAGAAGLAVALTACGSDDDSSSSSGAQDDSSAGSGGTDGGENAGAGGTALAQTSDIPEGGGKIFENEGVVVTQPTAGDFKAFSATCTHKGCAVKSISDGLINCPCHNSNFSITDGSVQSGPAPQALPTKEIAVSGDSIQLA